MQQEEKELRLGQLRLIVIVMTLIFLFMAVYTTYFIIDYNEKYDFFEKTTAEVIEHQVIDGVEYDLLSYKVNGNEFRITTEYASKNDIGDTITIYYDINNPLGIVYSLDSRRIWLPVLTSIFASANIALVVVYILIRKGVFAKKKVVVTKGNVENKEGVKPEQNNDMKEKTVVRKTTAVNSSKTNTQNKVSKKSTNNKANKTTTKSSGKTSNKNSSNKNNTKKVD